jgi:outer membrane lipoprotein-sorting protein
MLTWTFKALLVSFFCLNSNLMFAAQVQNMSKDDLRNLQLKMKSAAQLTVDFVQYKSVKIRPKQRTKVIGRGVFAKPSKFKWTIIEPKADSLIFDGQKLFSIQEDKKTATSFSADADRAQEIREVIDLVLDFDSLLGRYDVAEATKESNKVNLLLNPKKPGALTNLNVRVDAATAMVEMVKMTFTNKNTSEFEFSNPDRSALPKDAFALPAGYKIIPGL